ncbi:MAG: hypothetical protein J6568_07465 [Snodgrassella sp.]|nr:hypothetical protein [Snodgrassella sp.]
MKKVLVAFLYLFLVSCAMSVTPENKFEKGEYIAGVNILASNYDVKSARLKEKNKPWKDKDVAYLKNTVNKLSVMAQENIVGAAATDYHTRIENYKLLLTMKTQLQNKSYSQFIEDFLTMHDEQVLKKKIAEQFYEQANAVVVNGSQDYLRKAKIYREGLSYYAYKDISKRAEDNQRLYYKTAAEEFYSQAKDNVNKQDYKQAAINFRKAHEVYLPLGKYKDSAKLAAVYEKKWRTIEAENHYHTAQSIVRNASNSSDYRKASELFRQAADLYRAYGDYKNSQKLTVIYDKKWRTMDAEDSYQRGQEISRNATRLKDYRDASVYYSKAAQVYSPYGDYKGASQLADSHYKKGLVSIFINTDGIDSRDIRSELDKSFVRFVPTSAQANLIIHVRTKGDYQINKEEAKVFNRTVHERVGTEKVDDGNGNLIDRPVMKETAYVEYSQTTTNKAYIKAWVHIWGIYEQTKHYYGQSTSSETLHWFSNGAPARFKPYTKGRLSNKEKLFEQARTNLWWNMRDDIHYLSSQLDDL